MRVSKICYEGYHIFTLVTQLWMNHIESQWMVHWWVLKRMEKGVKIALAEH
jgi:hypothetical protein